MNGEVGCAIIAQRVKIVFQPLLSSIRANWEFSSNCDDTLKTGDGYKYLFPGYLFLGRRDRNISVQTQSIIDGPHCTFKLL